MNILDKIKLLWSAKGFVEEEYQEATKMDGAKPGWKTSTFWIKIFTVDLPVLYMGIKQFIPAKDAAIIEVVAMGLYGVYRTVVDTTKQIQAAKAGQTTVTTTAPVTTVTTPA